MAVKVLIHFISILCVVCVLQFYILAISLPTVLEFLNVSQYLLPDCPGSISIFPSAVFCEVFRHVTVPSPLKTSQ